MRILVVRFAAIGDCVMTAWAVTALKRTCPTAEIVWAVQERCSDVVDTDNLVSLTHVVPRGRWKKHRWSPTTWREQFLTYTRLRAHRFDVGFDFQGHSKTAILLRLSGAKTRLASRATDVLASFLNHPVNLSPEGPHEVQLAHALVQRCVDCDLPDYPLMPETGQHAGFWTNILDASRPIVSIQTGAGEKSKTYPAEQFSDVAASLVSRGMQVVAIGGKSDPHLAVEGVLDAVGHHDLRSAMALIALSSVHLASDTGTGHIAAALGTPVVSVFGPTDPRRYRPWTEAGMVLQSDGPISNIPPETVTDAVVTLVEEAHGARSR